MASQLEDQFGESAPRAIAAMIRVVLAEFPHDAFLAEVREGYGPLSLTQRGLGIAAGALRKHLPEEYPRAVRILLESASQPHEHRAFGGMAAFLYMPHLFFVAQHGLERRLATIHARVCELLDEHAPAAVSMEDIYFGANARARSPSGRRAAS